jgi:hypothetical protein
MPVFANQYNFMGAPLETFDVENATNSERIMPSYPGNIGGNKGAYNEGNKGEYNEMNYGGNKGAYNEGNKGEYNEMNYGGNKGAYNEGNKGENNEGENNERKKMRRRRYKINNSDEKYNKLKQSKMNNEGYRVLSKGSYKLVPPPNTSEDKQERMNQINTVRVDTNNEINNATSEKNQMEGTLNDLENQQKQTQTNLNKTYSDYDKIMLLLNDLGDESRILDDDENDLESSIIDSKDSNDNFYLDGSIVKNIMSNYESCKTEKPRLNEGHRGRFGDGNEQDEELKWYCDNCDGYDLKDGCIPKMSESDNTEQQSFEKEITNLYMNTPDFQNEMNNHGITNLKDLINMIKSVTKWSKKNERKNEDQNFQDENEMHGSDGEFLHYILKKTGMKDGTSIPNTTPPNKNELDRLREITGIHGGKTALMDIIKYVEGKANTENLDLTGDEQQMYDEDGGETKQVKVSKLLDNYSLLRNAPKLAPPARRASAILPPPIPQQVASFTNYEGFDGSLNPSNLNNNQMMNNAVQENENMLNVNLLLKSLLFACLFYILSHESSVKMAKKVVGKMKPDMLNLVMLAVFAVVYYVISMFI